MITYRLQTDNGALVAEVKGVFFPNGSPRVVLWGTRTFTLHEVRLDVLVYREAFAFALVPAE